MSDSDQGLAVVFPEEASTPDPVLFEKNPHAMWVYDMETLRFLTVNETAVQHYGYSREEFLSMTLRDIRPREDEHQMLAAVAKAKQGREGCSAGIFRHRKKNGEVISVEISSKKVLYQGRVAEVILSYDVSARVRLEKERQELLEKEQAARQAAERAVQVREEFLSIASHEMKTPLTSISLALQALKESPKQARLSPQSRAEILEMAERDMQRIIRLVDDLLDVSRIRSGRIDLSRRQADLAPMIRQLLEDFGKHAKLAGCTLRAAIADSVFGNWDTGKIEQVMINLLSNAIKFGAGKPVEVVLEKSATQAIVWVTDQGIGIPEDKVELIFEPFERGHASSRYQGLGLGLYIARQIVLAHGGDIRFESSQGVGSRFRVALPL